MKENKRLLCISLFALGLNFCFAQQRTIERIHLTTDRSLYVAGETIRLSLYCFDMTTREIRLSNLSSVAYVELRNDASLVADAKLAIVGGRGGGKIAIPPSLPTGNYRLIAYTKQMLNEEDWRYFDKILPICNTLSPYRNPEKVLVTDLDPFDALIPLLSIESGGVYLQWTIDPKRVPQNRAVTLSLINSNDKAVTFSISIARVDFPEPDAYSLQEFLARPAFDPTKIKFTNRYIPEYEGEIISGRMHSAPAALLKDQSVFLSAIGSGIDFYASSVDVVTGTFSFFTHALYGNREIMLGCPNTDEVSFELLNPFVAPPVAPVPAFHLKKEYEHFLTERSVEMQVARRFGLDTLYEQTVVPNNPFPFYHKPTVYQLDNYTRFPTMQDITVEFIPEMRFRKINNRTWLQILTESYAGWNFSEQNSLVLVDGIIIFDHDRLLQYDPLKVKTISIYKTSYNLGGQIFDGIATFNTYQGNYPDLSLGKNALILDFEGMQYPCIFTGDPMGRDENRPDNRSLLYWDPQVDLMPGASRELTIKTSFIPGKYAVILEGIDSDSRPVYHRSEFWVE